MLPDKLLITKLLLRRFVLEANLEGGNGQHYAIMVREGGHIVAHNPHSPELDPLQFEWATALLRYLNRELHHGGAWVIAFTHPEAPALAISNMARYRRYAIIWLDHDGDPQFSQEWAKGEGEMLNFEDVMDAGLWTTAMKAEAAWSLWHHHMRDVLAPGEGQTFARAAGETPSSLKH